MPDGFRGRQKREYRPRISGVHTIALLLYHGDLQNEKNGKHNWHASDKDGESITTIYKYVSKY